MSFKYTALCTQNVQPLLNAQYPLNITFTAFTFCPMFTHELRFTFCRVYVLLSNNTASAFLTQSRLLFGLFSLRLVRKGSDILRISPSLSHNFDTATYHSLDATVYLTRVMLFPHSHARDTSIGYLISSFTVERIFLAYPRFLGDR